jgi:hypothetical protein
MRKTRDVLPYRHSADLSLKALDDVGLEKLFAD